MAAVAEEAGTAGKRRGWRLPDRLPSLEGRRGAVVGWAYLALAALTLLLAAANAALTGLDMFRNIPADAAYGFGTVTDTYTPGHPVQVYWTAPGAQARGLNPNDRIVAVDGRRMPADVSEFDIGAAVARGGDMLTLTVRAADMAAERTVALPRLGSGWTQTNHLFNLPVWLQTGTYFLFSQAIPAFLLMASLLLYRRRPRDPEAVLFAFAFLMICYNVSFLWWLDLFVRLPLASVTLAIGGLGWTAAFIAIAGFPAGRFETAGARAAALYTLVAGPVSLAVLLLEMPYGGAVAQTLFASATVIVVATVARRYRRTPAGPERQQIKWAVLGFCVMAPANVILYTPLSQLVVQLPQPARYFAYQTLQLMILIGPTAGLLVSQLRYRLYDADAAISRSVAYGVMTLTLLAVFAGSEKAIELLGAEYFGGTMGALAGGLGAAVAAVLIVPLHHRFGRWAERRFQKNLIELRQGLPALVGDLRETSGSADVAEEVVQRVERGVRARRCALVVDGKPVAARHVEAGALARWLEGWTPPAGDRLDCDKADPLFPMRVPLDADGWGRVGWLLLGPRPDGSFYGKDEREALAAIADPVARALQIVLLREARERQQESRFAALERKLARALKALGLAGRKAEPAG